MNIAFVNSTKIWSGVKTWMLEFGRGLQKQGNRVYFFARDPQFVKEAGKERCTAFQLNFGSDYSPGTIHYFHKKFQELEIDITCMNIQKELRTAGIAARMLKIPVIHRVGLPSDINRKWDQRLAQKWIVDEILVTSRWIKTELARRFDFISEDKICLIPNAKPIKGKHKSAINRPVAFVATSRLAKGKGHLTMIKAFKKIYEQGFNAFTCDIYGNGPLENEIRRAIENAGLQNHVFLKGFHTEIGNLLSSYDFGLLASQVEGLSNTISEYLAAGLPCIATDGSGIIELVDHGKNGYLFNYSDVDRLAETLANCLQMDDETYRELSRQAHVKMREMFDPRTNFRRLENYFLETVWSKETRMAHRLLRSTNI